MRSVRAGHGGETPRVRHGELAPVHAGPRTEFPAAARRRVQHLPRGPRPRCAEMRDQPADRGEAAARRISRGRDLAPQRQAEPSHGRHRADAAQRGEAARGNRGKVVVHPVAIRYFFDGDLEATVKPVLASIEKRLVWQTQDSLPLMERILKCGAALLSLKEIEFFGSAQAGTLAERITRLLDRMLSPLEDEWLKGRHETNVVARVKLLRAAILPDLITGDGGEAHAVVVGEELLHESACLRGGRAFLRRLRFDARAERVHQPGEPRSVQKANSYQ